MQQKHVTRSTGLAVGLMSGTSGDGIDAVLVRFTEKSGDIAAPSMPEMTWVASHYAPFSPEQRDAVFRLFDPNVSARHVARIDTQLGTWFSDAVTALLKEANVPPKDVAVIGSHGQTVYHSPQEGVTWQIGNPAIIAERTGCPVVSDFRRGDVAAGGQGAPLVPYFDHAYLSSLDRPRIVLNIGGISNITVLPRDAKLNQVTAFDTGPGNMLIDGLAYQLSSGETSFDRDGNMAAQGTPALEIVDKWVATDDYFRRVPPKSTGREEYGVEFLPYYTKDMKGLGVSDQLATITRFVAQTVAVGIKLAVKEPYDLVLSGGGRYNQTLVRWIQELAKPRQIISPEQYGIPSDMKEAMAFALMAWQFLHGRPTNVPSATGASRQVVLGQWTPGPA